MSRVLPLAAFCCALALPGFAGGPVQARFILGATSYLDEGLDHRTTVGGSVRYYISKHWAIEPEYLFQHTGRNHEDHVLWGNFTFDFRDRDKRVVPYWVGSPGVIHSITRYPPQRFTNTEFAGSTGAGVRIFLTERVFVAPQFRLGVADSIFSEVTGSVGFVLRK